MSATHVVSLSRSPAVEADAWNLRYHTAKEVRETIQQATAGFLDTGGISVTQGRAVGNRANTSSRGGDRFEGREVTLLRLCLAASGTISVNSLVVL